MLAVLALPLVEVGRRDLLELAFAGVDGEAGKALGAERLREGASGQLGFAVVRRVASTRAPGMSGFTARGCRGGDEAAGAAPGRAVACPIGEGSGAAGAGTAGGGADTAGGGCGRCSCGRNPPQVISPAGL